MRFDQRRRLLLLAIGLVPMLSACAPALVATGAAATLISAHDRRSTGIQADDEISEWKGGNRLPEKYRDVAHVNFTAFNRRLLVTGEVPDEEARQALGAIAEKIEGVRRVYNELQIGPPASFSSRANDAFISSSFKARLLDSTQLSANHVKPLTENGTLFLMGLVTEREARAAVDLARSTAGVRKVVSVLEILPDAEIRKIDEARLGGRRAAPASASEENP
jgi:osmotically-inducible protein OsmY